ncbi:MAG: TIGR02281 family clan AA aspartic protease [Novosphingobium sp.]|nr:TIGR02281 family clan AA aspartic protease [Novosphingobium sp.]
MTLPALRDLLLAQPLLALAIGAILLTTLGGMLRRPVPALAGLLHGIGSLGLVAALLLTVAQVARINGSINLSLPQLGMPEQQVVGAETRIPMAPDGHFWIRARINGVPTRMMVDTGATLTAIDADTAEQAGVALQQWNHPVVLRTANGAMAADLGTISELRFGNVVARDLDAVITPGEDSLNVIGMNFLSRLASWRVEGNTLILVPKHPQAQTSGRADQPSPDV